MANVTYVKALRISKHEYEVGCEYDDGTYRVDAMYRDGASVR